jgi:hypothetical protein
VTRAAAIAAVSAGLALGGIWASGAFGDPGIPGTPATVFRTVTETRTVDRRVAGHSSAYWHWRNGQHIRERDAAERRVQALKHRRDLAYRPTVDYAIAIARSVYGVDQTRRVECESHGDVYAHNSSGASSILQFLPSTWATTPFAGFSIWDPVAQALAGGWMVADAHRSGEWTCGL